MALSTDVRLSLGWPPRPTIRAHVHPADTEFPDLAETIYLEIHSGAYDRICISGTPRQLHELLIDLAAAVRGAVPAARQAAAHARAAHDQAKPAPDPEPAVSTT